MSGFWFTEVNTYVIRVQSEREAQEVWRKYQDGTPWWQLPMGCKDQQFDADWEIPDE